MKLMKLAPFILILLAVIPLSFAEDWTDPDVFYKLDDGTGTNVRNNVTTDLYNGTLTGTFVWNSETWYSQRTGNANLECNNGGDSNVMLDTNYYGLSGSGATGSWSMWMIVLNDDGWYGVIGNGDAVNDDYGFTVQVSSGSSDLRLKVNNGGTSVNTPINVGATFLYTVARHGAIYSVYINKTFIHNVTGDSNINGTTLLFQRCRRPHCSAACDNVKIDEVSLYDFALSQEDINNKFNNESTKVFYWEVGAAPPPPAANNTGTIDILFRNETNKIYKTTFQESEDFIVELNYTWMGNNSPIADGLCNVTILKAITSDDSFDTNFTICGTSCDYIRFTDNFTLITSNAINDSIHFDACHESSSTGDFILSLGCSDGTEEWSILNTDITNCETGLTRITKKTDICIGQSNVNLSTIYTGINNKRKRIEELDLDREFSQIDIVLTYNTTSLLFDYTEDFECYEHGTKTINANCTAPVSDGNKDVTETITIVNVPPKVTIDSITLNGTSIQFNQSSNNFIEFVNGTWTFNIIIEDDDFSNGSVQFLNNTNEVILSFTLPGTISATGENFQKFFEQPFNITVMAEDTSGALGNASILFNVTDINMPHARGISNSTIANGTEFSWTVMFYDENFYGFSVVCSGGSSFSANVTGLDVTSYNFTNETTINDNTTCTWRYCDGHTSNKLKKKWDMIENGNVLEFRIDSYYRLLLESLDEVEKFSWKEKEDRINFDIKMLDSGWHTFYYHSRNSQYVASDKYNAWVVDWNTKTWFDFNPYDTQVFKINSTTWEIRLYSDNKHLKFDSIGELNCFEQTQFIEALVPETFADTEFQINKCPETTAGILGFYLMFALLFVLLIINWKRFKIPVFTMILGIMFMLMSYFISGCHNIIWFAPFLFGLIVFISSWID